MPRLKGGKEKREQLQKWTQEGDKEIDYLLGKDVGARKFEAQKII